MSYLCQQSRYFDIVGRHTQTILLGCGVFLGTFLIARPGYAEGTGVSPDRVVLAQSAAFTGAYAGYAIQFGSGARLFFDQVNAHGGIYGRRIDMVSDDDQDEPASAAENTRNDLADEHVFALFGYVGSDTTLAALPLASKQKVPMFAPVSGSPLLRDPFNRWLFNVRAGYREETQRIVSQLFTINLHRIAVFYEQGHDGQAGLDGVNNALQSHGLKPVAVAAGQPHAAEAADKTTQQAARDFVAANPDAVILVAGLNASANLIKAMRGAGYLGQFYATSIAGGSLLAERLGREGEGLIVSETVPSPWSPQFAIVSEYQKAVEKSGSKNFDFRSLEGYIAAKVFVEIAKAAGRDLTREKFIRTAETMGPINVGDFVISFSPASHNGSTYSDLVIVGHDGHFIR